MPQGPLGFLDIGVVGINTALNLTAAQNIKVGTGRTISLFIIAPGTTSGAWTFNDCATTGAAAASNQVFSIPYNHAANLAGNTFSVNFPFKVGITLSAVPGSGSPIATLVYD